MSAFFRDIRDFILDLFTYALIGIHAGFQWVMGRVLYPLLKRWDEQD